MKKLTVILSAFVMVFVLMSFIVPFNGIDVSHFNTVNWDAVEDNNIEYCYIKVSEGSNKKDFKRLTHASNAHKHHIKVGCYHYFRTGVSGEAQFKNFQKAVKDIDMDIIPAIDVESQGNNFSDIKSVNYELKELINLMYRTYGKYPVIYMGSKVSLKTFSSTYKCPYWVRCVGIPPVAPSKIRQVGIEEIGGQPLDVNYCANVSSLSIVR